MPFRNIEVEIEEKRGPWAAPLDEGRFIWSLRATGPVRYLFRSSASYPTRAAALADFQAACEILGWENHATQVPVVQR